MAKMVNKWRKKGEQKVLVPDILAEREKKNEVKSEKRQDTLMLVGLIIERVGGRREPCWSDRSAELKPSSGSLSCPTDVKVSAPEAEKGDVWRMLTAQGCL